MTSHGTKAQALAAKITKMAEDGLGPLERMMDSPGWTPEFRAIMWGAVADIANNRRVAAERARHGE